MPIVAMIYLCSRALVEGGTRRWSKEWLQVVEDFDKLAWLARWPASHNTAGKSV